MIKKSSTSDLPARNGGESVTFEQSEKEKQRGITRSAQTKCGRLGKLLDMNGGEAPKTLTGNRKPSENLPEQWQGTNVKWRGNTTSAQRSMATAEDGVPLDIGGVQPPLLPEKINKLLYDYSKIIYQHYHYPILFFTYFKLGKYWRTCQKAHLVNGYFIQALPPASHINASNSMRLKSEL